MAAQIFIKINKPFYFAGETIEGQVYFYLYQQMHANQVLIKFKGWEQAKWIDENQILLDDEKNRVRHQCWHQEIFVKMDTTDSSSEQGEEESSKHNYVTYGGRIYQVRRRTGGRIIVKNTSILHNFGGQYILPGQYVFPFCYKTAENFPASFSHKALDRKSKGRIKYEMRVFVRGFNSRRRLIKHNTQIVIRQTTVIKNEQKQMIAHVKSCCCIDKGVSKIKCYFDKNGYAPGQDAKIYCIIDNKACIVDVTRVTVKLINQITFTSKDNYNKQIKNQILRYEFPGLPAGGQNESEKTINITSNSNKTTTKAQNDGQIMPTARGERVKSVYFLVVEAVLNASCTCCSDLPKVRQQVVIYPYMHFDYVFHQPAQWQPVLMPLINLQQAVSATNENLNNMQNPYY